MLLLRLLQLDTLQMLTRSIQPLSEQLKCACATRCLDMCRRSAFCSGAILKCWRPSSMAATRCC